MLYFHRMDSLTNTQADQNLEAIAATYKSYKERAQALENEQEALLKQAMKILQEDKMIEARKKLESMLH